MYFCISDSIDVAIELSYDNYSYSFCKHQNPFIKRGVIPFGITPLLHYNSNTGLITCVLPLSFLFVSQVCAIFVLKLVDECLRNRTTQMLI